jgi:hypothetical protein
MEYNTKRTKMIITEYGRHVHIMIWQALNMKDRDKRNSFARRIIKIMEDRNPKIRCLPNFHHKLWDQLFIMSEFKLDVDSPFSKPNTDTVHIPFRKVSYPEYLRDYRYYGKIVREMIRVASDCQDLQKKEVLIYAIANIMKKNYIRCNKKTIEDSVVFDDLRELSKGKIVLESSIPLLNHEEIIKKKVIW